MKKPFLYLSLALLAMIGTAASLARYAWGQVEDQQKQPLQLLVVGDASMRFNNHRDPPGVELSIINHSDHRIAMMSNNNLIKCDWYTVDGRRVKSLNDYSGGVDFPVLTLQDMIVIAPQQRKHVFSYPLLVYPKSPGHYVIRFRFASPDEREWKYLTGSHEKARHMDATLWTKGTLSSDDFSIKILPK